MAAKNGLSMFWNCLEEVKLKCSRNCNTIALPGSDFDQVMRHIVIVPVLE
jgi:hypothetical protein